MHFMFMETPVCSMGFMCQYGCGQGRVGGESEAGDVCREFFLFFFVFLLRKKRKHFHIPHSISWVKNDLFFNRVVNKRLTRVYK